MHSADDSCDAEEESRVGTENERIMRAVHDMGDVLPIVAGEQGHSVVSLTLPALCSNWFLVDVKKCHLKSVLDCRRILQRLKFETIMENGYKKLTYGGS